jgi:GUN4-like/ARM-like repeat domain, GUN4-N terminal
MTAFMTNLDQNQALREEFLAATEKNQLLMIDTLAPTPSGQQVLRSVLEDHRNNSSQVFSKYGAVNAVAAKAYQRLYNLKDPEIQRFLADLFPTGIVPLKSDLNVDYLPLQQLLVEQNFLEADKLNNLKLCELAGEASLARKWIYFTEVNGLPATDLRTLNALWLAHSEGRFGYSVQRELWVSVGRDWIKLWSKILWKDGNNWTRYPGSFDWTIAAPKGHLPLSNQLRGVRVITSLLTHPAWD